MSTIPLGNSQESIREFQNGLLLQSIFQIQMFGHLTLYVRNSLFLVWLTQTNQWSLSLANPRGRAQFTIQFIPFTDALFIHQAIDKLSLGFERGWVDDYHGGYDTHGDNDEGHKSDGGDDVDDDDDDYDDCDQNLEQWPWKRVWPEARPSKATERRTFCCTIGLCATKMDWGNKDSTTLELKERISRFHCFSSLSWEELNRGVERWTDSWK